MECFCCYWYTSYMDQPCRITEQLFSMPQQPFLKHSKCPTIQMRYIQVSLPIKTQSEFSRPTPLFQKTSSQPCAIYKHYSVFCIISLVGFGNIYSVSDPNMPSVPDFLHLSTDRNCRGIRVLYTQKFISCRYTKGTQYMCTELSGSIQLRLFYEEIHLT